MLNTARRILVASVLLLGAVTMMAQPKFNSPYSRFGLGDLANSNLPSLNGMGDIGAAFRDPFHLNIVNPASLTSLTSTAFEIGLDVRYSSWSSGTSNLEENVWSGNISHVALAFPLKNGFTRVLEGKKSDWEMGMAFSLIPKTQVGYNIRTQELVENSDDPVNYENTGEGGINSLNWGYGVSYKELSLGVNVGFLFGSIRNNAIGSLLTTNSFEYIKENDFNVNGVLLNFGGQYNIILPDAKATKDGNPSQKKITIGAYAALNSDVRVTENSLIFRERQALGFAVRDTFEFKNEEETDGIYPGEIGIGVHYVHENKLRVGINYTRQGWSKYVNEAAPNDNFSDATTFSVGASYTPNFKNYKSYWERINYKAGFVTRNDYRSVLNNSLTNYGVTFGFGLPVILPRQGVSFVNLGFELGRFGTEESLQETYAQLSLGFTLNDNSWFFKRKFN